MQYTCRLYIYLGLVYMVCMGLYGLCALNCVQFTLWVVTLCPPESTKANKFRSNLFSMGACDGRRRRVKWLWAAWRQRAQQRKTVVQTLTLCKLVVTWWDNNQLEGWTNCFVFISPHCKVHLFDSYLKFVPYQNVGEVSCCSAWVSQTS